MLFSALNPIRAMSVNMRV